MDNESLCDEHQWDKGWWITKRWVPLPVPLGSNPYLGAWEKWEEIHHSYTEKPQLAKKSVLPILRKYINSHRGADETTFDLTFSSFSQVLNSTTPWSPLTIEAPATKLVETTYCTRIRPFILFFYAFHICFDALFYAYFYLIFTVQSQRRFTMALSPSSPKPPPHLCR